jgi:xanthine dehydrogenase accessory factor
MLIREDGLLAGSVSGSFDEGAVKEAACHSLSDGKCKRLDFGVSDETAWPVGLYCGSEVSVWICPYQAMQDGLLEDVSTQLSQH